MTSCGRSASLPRAKRSPQRFPAQLATQFEKMSAYAKNEHMPVHLRTGIKRRRHGANVKPIKENTIEKLRYQLNAWVKWLRAGGKTVEGIERFLEVGFLEDYLDDKNKSQDFTLETAMTTLSNAKTFVRLANATGITSIDTDAWLKEVGEIEQFVLQEPWKPSRNAVLAKPGSMPKLATIHSHYVREVQREALKWTATFKELRSPNLQSNPSSSVYSALMDLRGAVFFGIEMYMSPRVGDCRLIPASSLRRLEEFYHIGWQPGKTRRTHNSPEVDVCIPFWLTGLLEDYLLLRRFIHPTSPALFPAFRVAQERCAESLKDGLKKNISYGQFQDLAKSWSGADLANNLMRKVVGKTYKSLGLLDLHKTLGHSKRSREADMTDDNTVLERDAYLILDDDDRVEIARKNFLILAKKLEVVADLDLSFLDKTTREILRSSS